MMKPKPALQRPRASSTSAIIVYQLQRRSAVHAGYWIYLLSSPKLRLLHYKAHKQDDTTPNHPNNTPTPSTTTGFTHMYHQATTNPQGYPLASTKNTSPPNTFTPLDTHPSTTSKVGRSLYEHDAQPATSFTSHSTFLPLTPSNPHSTPSNSSNGCQMSSPPFPKDRHLSFTPIPTLAFITSTPPITHSTPQPQAHTLMAPSHLEE